MFRQRNETMALTGGWMARWWGARIIVSAGEPWTPVDRRGLLARGFVLVLVSVLVFTIGAAVAGENVLSEHSARQFAERYGERATQRLRAWEEMMRVHHDSAEPEKLLQVNAFFNQLPWVSDQTHWGRRDYWATPLEMMGTNGGDCEDYSVAKFITLLHMGIDPQRLRITYVRAVQLRQPHMVVAYYATPGAQPLILDNLIPQIKPGAQRPDLVPVYSFNTAGLWASKADGETRRLGASARLSAWRDVSRRLREEGLDVGVLGRTK